VIERAVSGEYFDKYLFESDPRLLREIAEALVSMLPEGVDALAGLELGGIAAEGVELRSLFTMSGLRQSVGTGSLGG
jgi:hypothetical protein